MALDLFQLARPSAVDLEALVREHTQMVYRIAYSVLRNHHDAEDAAQEAFLRVFSSASRLAGVADLKAWVARVAWNTARDYVRKSRQSRSEPAAVTDLQELVRNVNALRDAGDGVEEIAAAREMQRLLGKLIQTLPARLRGPLLLSTIEELSHAELAAALGISEAAARSRLHQGRRVLKEKLDGLLGVLP